MKNPASIEAQVMRSMHEEAASVAQDQVRKMLMHMIDLVPGQLFRDIEQFHKKFGLEPTDDGHRLPADVLKFRVKFLQEELNEYCEAVGVSGDEVQDHFDAEKAFDGLIDLVYVALGTAYLHKFPFNQGWNRVQQANMSKVRAEGAEDERSHRKHAADIVKPEGWKPPVLEDLLKEKT